MSVKEDYILKHALEYIRTSYIWKQQWDCGDDDRRFSNDLHERTLLLNGCAGPSRWIRRKFLNVVLVVVAGSDIANRRVFSSGPRNDGVFLRCTTWTLFQIHIHVQSLNDRNNYMISNRKLKDETSTIEIRNMLIILNKCASWKEKM